MKKKDLLTIWFLAEENKQFTLLCRELGKSKQQIIRDMILKLISKESRNGVLSERNEG